MFPNRCPEGQDREEANQMFLVNQAMIDVPVGTAALIVVLGMAVVFCSCMDGISYKKIW